MTNIKELALKIAEEVYGAPIDSWAAEQFCDFTTRFLAAYLKDQEPVGKVLRNSAGQVWIIWKGETDVSDYVGRQLFTAPPLPAGEIVVTADEMGRCVAVTRQDEEGRILNVIWEAEPLPAIPDHLCLVPREPTPKMVDATWNEQLDVCESHNSRNNRIYKAMLAAGEVKP